MSQTIDGGVLTLLPDPDEVGDSAYRALYDLLVDSTGFHDGEDTDRRAAILTEIDILDGWIKHIRWALS